MPIYESQEQSDLEDQGEVKRELVAVKYVGNQSTYRNQAVNNQGHWPGQNNFQNESWNVGLIPERNLGWWESNQNFEISYKESDLAEAFLSENYLPPTAFSVNADPEIQDAVFEKLGLEPERDMDGYRDQLLSIEGVDSDKYADEEQTEQDSRKQYLESEFSRSDYKRALDELDPDFKLNQSNEEMIDHLMEFDDGKVNSLLKGESTSEESDSDGEDEQSEE